MSQNSTNVSEIDISRRLQIVLENNPGYQFIQENGQRVLEPQPILGIQPPQRGCEIFIGNIPRNLFEDDLLPLFQAVGPLYNFRLMLDFSQKNRGYAFACYFNADHANEALNRLNGHEIRRGARLGIYKSIDNRRLFIGGIPRNVTQREVIEVFNCFVEGIANVLLFPSSVFGEQNRGYAFVEFISHRMASIARRQMHPRNFTSWGQRLYVDWAYPIPEVDPVVMRRGILGPNIIRKVHTISDYAFVHCVSREAAEFALATLEGTKIAGQMINVEWARPREYSSQVRAAQPPENYCLSVPIRARRIIQQLAVSRRNLNSSQESGPNSSESSGLGSDGSQ